MKSFSDYINEGAGGKDTSWTRGKTTIDEADVMPGRTARRSRIENAADATKKKFRTTLAIGGTVAALGGIGYGLHATKDARPDMNDTKPDTSHVYKLTPKEEAERKKLHDTLMRNGEIYRESVDQLPLYDREGKKYIKTGLLGRIRQALTTASSITKKPSGPSERPTVDPNERRRRNSRGGTYQGDLTNRGIGVVDEAAKTTGEYRKDALEREAEFRRSVEPRQRKLQGKPLQSRKRTMAAIAAGVAAHKQMQAEYKIREPTSWSPSPKSANAGSYIDAAGHRVRDERGAWSFGSTGPLGDGMDNPPHLWFSHGGDHLAIHSAVNPGHPTGGQLHSDLPDFHRAEGQDPMIQGRIDHARKRITYLSLQSRASGFGERVINAQKRRMANRLTKKYPGYTHHDSDNNQEPF